MSVIDSRHFEKGSHKEVGYKEKAILDQVRSIYHDFKRENDKALEIMRTRNEEQSSEQAEKIEKMNGDIDKLLADLQQLESSVSKYASEVSTRGLTTGSNMDSMSETERLQTRAFVKTILQGQSMDRLEDNEKRALSGLRDTDGGLLVPATMERMLIKEVYEENVIRKHARVTTVSSPRVERASIEKASADWGYINNDMAVSELSTGEAYTDIHHMYAVYKIHKHLLEDTEIDLVRELIDGIRDAMNAKMEEGFTTGTGNGQPVGFLSSDAVRDNNVVSGIAAAIVDSTHNGFDKLLELKYSLKTPYHGRAIWGMNLKTERVLRQVKDENGRYLWDESLKANNPKTLFGRPVENMSYMPDVAAGAYPITYSDFTYYRIYDRSGIAINIAKELFALSGYVGYLCTLRTGGAPVKPEAFTVLKVAAS